MTKKLLLSITPLIAVVVLSVMPAMASAAETYGTETGGIFTPFPTGTKENITSKKVAGSGNIILNTEAGTIICKSLIDHGFVINEGTPVVKGHSTEKLEFDECTMGVESLTCPLETAGAGSGNIIVNVTDKVESSTTVKVTVEPLAIAFSGTPPTGCPPKGTALGTVTGSVTGSQAAKSNRIKFAAATGLKLNGTIDTKLTGEDEILTTPGGLKVVI